MLKNPSQKRCSKELRDDSITGYCKRGGNWLISFQRWGISLTLKILRPRLGGVFLSSYGLYVSLIIKKKGAALDFTTYLPRFACTKLCQPCSQSSWHDERSVAE